MKLKIIAICSGCKLELHQSIEMTKSQLKKNWDKAVLGAVNIPCKKCNYRFPNFAIDFVIRDAVTGVDYPVTKFIRVKDKGIQKAVAERFVSVHQEALKASGDKSEIIRRVTEQRREMANGKK